MVGVSLVSGLGMRASTEYESISIDGSIRIDYGYFHRTDFTRTDKAPFHTRQIVFPVLFTVYHTLECHSLDLMRFTGPRPQKEIASSSPQDTFLTPVKHGAPRNLSPGTRRRRSGSRTPVTSGYLISAEDVLKAAMEEESDVDHCLLSIDVRNVYGVPFEFVLARVEDEGMFPNIVCLGEGLINRHIRSTTIRSSPSSPGRNREVWDFAFNSFVEQI